MNKGVTALRDRVIEYDVGVFDKLNDVVVIPVHA